MKKIPTALCISCSEEHAVKHMIFTCFDVKDVWQPLNSNCTNIQWKDIVLGREQGYTFYIIFVPAFYYTPM